MQSLTISTSNKREIVDVTDEVEGLIKKKDISLCFLFIKHTTAALTTADLDPGTDLDMLMAFDEIIPKLPYHHPHNPAHVPDHIMSSIIGGSISIPVANGKLDLGTWQRIVLVELDGPRLREVVVNFL